MYYICQICEKRFQHSFLNKHIKDFHGISLEEYYQKYLNTQFNNICYCGNTKKFNKLSRPYDNFCSRSCAIVEFHRNNPGELQKNIDFSLANKKMMTIHGKRIAEINSKRCSERIKDPNSNFGKRRGNISFYNSIRMKSSWEVKFAQLCDENNIEWQYEPKTFKIQDGQRYTPDFFLPKLDLWVEVKPTLFQETALEKIIKLKLVHNISINMLDWSDFSSFIEGII